MAIDVEYLIAPKGALTRELLVALKPAASSPEAVAQEYADAGDEKVAARTWTTPAFCERAALAWATYRALSDRAQQILSDPMSVSGDRAGAVGWSTSQAQELRKEAALYLASYEGAIAEDVAAAAVPPPPPATSRSVAVHFGW